jgi:hypothetical protein
MRDSRELTIAKCGNIFPLHVQPVVRILLTTTAAAQHT